MVMMTYTSPVMERKWKSTSKVSDTNPDTDVDETNGAEGENESEGICEK